MASPVSNSANPTKISFAKIAATGTIPANTPQNPTDMSNDKSGNPMAPSPQDGSHTVTAGITQNPSTNTSKPKKLVQLVTRDIRELGLVNSGAPHVQVDTAATTSPPHKASPAPDGMLMPSAFEDAGTVISSSDGDAKPPSLDGKSVASGATFALDEKESLRPDDSASVQAAAEEDDNFPTSASGIPSSRLGSDDGTRAFREQLHEIQEMGPPRRQQPGSIPSGNAAQGVLYVPPQGPGMGAVPGSLRPTTAASDKPGATPDVKLLEALENPRDRIWVLKLEQDVIDFIKDPKETSLNLPQCNSFYRMLAHKIADYYLLGHSVDESSAVRLYRSSSCRIPPPLTGIVTPSTAASTPPPTGPQMKILRRGIDPGPAIANGSNMASGTNSENGDSGDDKKKPATREEREARYEAARLRIMGSAKPAESPDIPKEKDDSRSSSAAGKKPKRKHRDNNDDGFEARSAYSSYLATPYPVAAYQQSNLAYQSMPSTQPTSHAPAQSTSPEMANFQQYSGAMPGMHWTGANVSQDASQSWYQNQNQHQNQHQNQAYDLSQHFGNAMSLQQAGMPNHSQSIQSPYGAGYPQQPYGMPGSWQSQSFTPSSQASANNYTAPAAYSSNTTSSPQQPQYSQQYPFGQLPSQAMGRPPNALEHPVPGSYKSPHFNPQSQTFVPTQASSPGFRPSMPQRAPTNTSTSNSYGMSYPLERQMSSQSQSSSFGSPHPSMHTNNTGSRMPSQPLTHPLPQPVFPRQPSPNVPLPPKPIANFPQQPQQQPQQHNQTTSARPFAAHSSPQQNTSSIAKWGTPASLPAKPPPTNEPFDPQRFAQAQRAPGYNGATANRLPSGNLQGLGGVPSMNSQAVLNGSYSPSGRRL